jgi:hypothetical protein
MDIVFPPVDCLRLGEATICFDALVDGSPVSCVVTERALSTAAAVDQVISPRETFVRAQAAVREAVARRFKESGIGPIVITQAEIG